MASERRNRTVSVSSITHEINQPPSSPTDEIRYVTIKYFPTGDAGKKGSESPDSGRYSSASDYSVTRSQMSPDGSTRITTTTTQRSSTRSTSSHGGDLNQVNGKADDVFLEHALTEFSRHAGFDKVDSTKVDDDEKKRTMERLTRERLARAAAQVGDEEVVQKLKSPKADGKDANASKSTTDVPQSPSWMTRDSLRQSFEKFDELQGTSRDPKRARSIDKDQSQMRGKKPIDTKGTEGDTSLQQKVGALSLLTGPDRISAVHASPERSAVKAEPTKQEQDKLLTRYEPRSLSTGSRSRIPRDEPWTNVAHDILKTECGDDVFKKRLDKQNKIFDAGAKKGNVFEGLPLFFGKLGIRNLFEKKTKATDKRATHSEGIGAIGYAVVLPNDRIPENDFFTPNRMFEVRARHGSFPTKCDDSKPAWRSLSIKFQDHDFDSPLDLILQSGRSSPYFNTDAIEDFYTAVAKNEAAFKEFLTSLPVYLETILEGVRHDIESYCHVHYHSQMTYDFVAKDGKKRLARFRVIPADGYPDKGRLKPRDQRDQWCTMLLQDDPDAQPNKYLQTEFRRRVEESGVSYTLQIQLHEWREGTDTNALYNPSIIWEDLQFPWQDVAKIRLLTVLPNDVTEVTRFNVGNVPKETLYFPEPTSKTDFNSVPMIRTEIYKTCSKLRSTHPPSRTKNDSVEYLIHVVTGDQQNAGVLVNGVGQKCDIYISLIGTDGRTAFLKLDRKTKNDFNRGVRATFTIQEKFIGDLQCVKVYKDKAGGKMDWFLDYIVVSLTYNNTCYSLPCYRWFNDQTPLHILREGTPILFDKETDFYMKRQRQAEVTIRQNTFKWRNQDLDPHFKGLPGYVDAGDNVDHLPGDLRTPNAHKRLLDWTKHLEGKNSIFKKVQHLVKPRAKKGKGVDEAFEEELADKLPDTKAYEMLQYILCNWRSDLEFGRQMLCGTMPLKISQLKALPDNFPLTDAMVKGLLEHGNTLQQEIDDGHLFLINYSELEEYAKLQLESSKTDSNLSLSTSSNHVSEDSNDSTTSTKSSKKSKKIKPIDIKKPFEGKDEKKYLCAPMVIMYLKGGVALLPLAIQLSQQPAEKPLIFTPNDDQGEYSDWLIAKMWVRVAEANMHHFTARILGSHLLLEPIAISIVRNLPAVHPITKLLFPYIQNLVTVNTIYRKCILSPGGALSEVLALGDYGIDLMKKQVQKFKKFSSLNLPENFANRGVLDPNRLPSYFYRDDSLALWEAIRDFTIDIICVYYDDDDQVRNDDELAVMLQDLAKNGYHGQVDLPRRFSTVEELVEFSTMVIFRATVQYSGLSRGMADIYSYPLNAPPCMMLPPPTEKRPSGYSAEYVHSLLPPSELQERYISTVMLMLVGFKNPEATLGQYPDKVFTDEKAVIAVKSFQKQLSEIEADIKKRSTQLDDWSYEYLLPSNIPLGITA